MSATPGAPHRPAWVPGARLVGDEAAHPDADAPLVGVLALQGDVHEHLRVLDRVGAATTRVRSPEDLAGLDALVVPGGESTTIGRLLEVTGLLEPTRAAIRAGLPVLGTCAGLILCSAELVDHPHQPLLGGLDVRTRRNAFGRQVDSFDATVDVAGIEGGPIDVSFIRAPWVEEVLGDAVEVLAEVAGHPVVVRQGPVTGVAFHPEVTGDDRLHAAFVAGL